MELIFLHPWFVFVSVACALAAGASGFRTRRAAPLLLLLSAAGFFIAGARPQIGARSPDVTHALVFDVSGSMRSRPIDADALVDRVNLPAGHRFLRFELSDALRDAGAPRGEGTNFARLADLAADPRVTGEVVLITDGRGEIDKLYGALHPHRLILLRAPKPPSPDASVLSLQAPGYAPAGGTVLLRGMIRCDKDAEVPWRLLQGATEIAAGKARLRAEAPAEISHSQIVSGTGTVRFRLQLDLEGDREGANDAATTAIQVGGPLRVEYCTGPGIAPELDGMLQLLQADPRLEVNVRPDLPIEPEELEQASLVMLNNLSLRAAGLSREHTRDLADWVNSGGSLFMLGTDHAFGPGGFRNSPLEAVMPVRFRPEDAPPGRTLLLLDVSDSMNQPLSGGETRLVRLREAATRVIRTLGPDDFAAVAGFRERVLGPAPFLHSGDPELQQAIDGLRAQGSTHIGTSLRQALELLPPGGEGSRILMVTDGEDVESAGEAVFAELAGELAQREIRLDIVLTGGAEQPWSRRLASDAPGQVRLWSLHQGDFEDLIDLLDQALADADRDWVLQDSLTVPGVPTALPRLVRTAPRTEASVTTLLRAEQGQSSWPLLATRQLVGRTACLCSDSWGDQALVAFWQDDAFRARLSDAIRFVLGGAGRVNLVLNHLPEGGAELVWTGRGDPPSENLHAENGPEILADSPGRWLLSDLPGGEHLNVFAGERLLQRIPLPRPVPAELRVTGDDEVFFTVAEHGGIRVFSSLAAWQPQRVLDNVEELTDLTWLPALAAMVLLLAGFATRKL